MELLLKIKNMVLGMFIILITFLFSTAFSISTNQNSYEQKDHGYSSVDLRTVEETSSPKEFEFKDTVTAEHFLTVGYTCCVSTASNAVKGGLQYSDDLVRVAQKAYPNLAGKTQLHHITPKYLGGPANGPLIKLDAAYHQQITNAFRTEWGYGLGKPSAAQLEIIKSKVYSQFPLPK